MKKIKFVIEEIVSQEFEIEIQDTDNDFEEIRNIYRNGDIVLDQPNLLEANLMIYEENGEESEFSNMHVV